MWKYFITLIVFIFVNSKSQNSEMFCRTYLSWLISVSLTSTSASRSILSSTGSRTVLWIYTHMHIFRFFPVVVQEQFSGYIHMHIYRFFLVLVQEQFSGYIHMHIYSFFLVVVQEQFFGYIHIHIYIDSF